MEECKYGTIVYRDLEYIMYCDDNNNNNNNNNSNAIVDAPTPEATQCRGERY